MNQEDERFYTECTNRICDELVGVQQATRTLMYFMCAGFGVVIGVLLAGAVL